jgi:hypothetical protein
VTDVAPRARSLREVEGTTVPGAGAPQPKPSVRTCLDCGTPLTGKFCAVCGQKDEPLRRGLPDLAVEFFQHPLIDTKLWKSLVPLLLRPGALTEEYLAGKRTRYVRPLKLYITISVVFFALFAWRVPPEALKVQASPSADVKGNGPGHLPIRWLDERFQRNTAELEGAMGNAARLNLAQRIIRDIPKMVFFFLPLTAVLFKLFWWKRYFVEHLVFTLHLHSFTFASGLLLFLNWAPVTGVFLLWSTVYSGLAFQRMYKDGWFMLLLKLTGVSVLYSILLAAAVLITTFSALLAG